MTYKTKKFTNTNNKKYIFSYIVVANALCTIETNRTLNPVHKRFIINQI